MVIRKSLPFFALLFIANAPLLADEGWYPTYQEAQDAADESGLPLLIHFHASYCGPCRQMKRQVFSDGEIQRQLRNGIAAVEVDVSQRPDLAAQYGASTVPRDVVIYPGKEPKTIGIGFQSRVAYLGLLNKISREGIRIARMTTSNETPEETTSQEPIVGLEGFCPVKLIRDREWVSGREELSETYRGITYYFSSENEREEFRRSSRKYTPQNLGCDSIVLYSNQRAVTGKIKYGAFFDNQLFLFESAENRSKFKENPLRYSRIRHAVKATELSGRRFN